MNLFAWERGKKKMNKKKKNTNRSNENNFPVGVFSARFVKKNRSFHLHGHFFFFSNYPSRTPPSEIPQFFFRSSRNFSIMTLVLGRTRATHTPRRSKKEVFFFIFLNNTRGFRPERKHIRGSRIITARIIILYYL